MKMSTSEQNFQTNNPPILSHPSWNLSLSNGSFSKSWEFVNEDLPPILSHPSWNLSLSNGSFLKSWEFVKEDLDGPEKKKFKAEKPQGDTKEGSIVSETPMKSVEAPTVSPTSRIPCSTDYPGEFCFEIKCGVLQKSTSCTYSEELKRLYVRMDNTCPILFKTNNGVPDGSVIRATPMFINSEHIVKRCPTHVSLTEDQTAAEHIVHCKHKLARYVEDETHRLSVLVPHETPETGSEWVTNYFNFMCLTSCVGGPNRRPLQIVFTLENDQTILGRRSVHIRICASPIRDRNADEKVPLSRKKADEKELLGTNTMTVGKIDNTFTLKVTGEEKYLILQRIRDALDLVDLLTSVV